MASGRRYRSFVKELMGEDGQSIRNIETISEVITQFFMGLYTEDQVERPFIEGLNWQPIDNDKARWLERSFEEEEVKKATWLMDKEKTAGPDCFNMAFYQYCWDIVKEDLMKMFHEFFLNGKLPTSINSTFITIIHKKERSLNIKDFRPISLITSVYKIIAKIFSLRLGKVLGETILETQSAFVEGRQIIDAIIIASELVKDVRRKKQKGVVYKLDFEKAYDRINWSFLDKVLLRKGFGIR